MLQRVLTVVLVSLLMSSVLIAGTNGSLVGTVKDKTTKKGIPGVQIKVIGTTRGGVTKPDGRYTIANIPAGTYTVSIKSVAHKEKTIEVRIQADKETEENITLEDKTITTTAVEKTVRRITDADKPADANDVGIKRGVSGESVQRSAGVMVNATQAAARQAGVSSTAGGISIRGGRAENTQMQIDGQNISDLVSAGGSGLGAAASIAGAKYAPTTSIFATEDVQVSVGNFGASYGGTTDGVVNTVAKTGKTDKYEGYMRWVTDVPSLFGTAGNGLKAKSGLENTYEFGVGGPLPFLGKSTFFISTKYYSEANRDKGLDALDRLGNPINNIPAEGAVRNITGRMRFQLDDDIALIAGGTWGLTTLERASWGWYYANTPAMSFALNSAGTGVDTTIYSTVPENLAKQNAVNNFIGSYYLRLNHTLGDATFYEVTLSNTFNISEDARRKLPLGAGSLLVNGVIQDPSKVTTSAPGANFFKGYDLYYPEDNMVLTSNQSQMIARGTSPRDKTIDIYTPTRGRVYKIGNTIYTNNFFSPSNLTGYIEGPEDLSGTNNAYGLSNVFTARGNLDDARGRGFDFRMSNYLEAKGDYQTMLQTTVSEVKHTIKAGFDAQYFTIERYNNSLPWLGSPFYDVYTSQWGGDIYSDVASESEEGSRARHPWTLALYGEDQISYKGIRINPSLRLDIYNPSTLYRIDPILREGTRQSASIKIQPSPRIFISYPLNESGTNFFSIAYGLYTQTPKFSLLYDNTVAAVNRGNVLVGNPDLKPERTNQYNVSYNTAISEEFTFDVSAFYKDVYGLTGVTYIPDSRYPYSLYSNGEYGNSRGVEFSLRKRLSNNFEFNVNYTLAYSQGTSSGVGTNYSFVVLSGVDQYTEKKTFPLTEYALDYDRRHRVNAILNLVWGTEEGPSIGGIKFLQNTNISFNGLFQTGTPYTLLDLKGNQAGDYNAERQPSFWNIDARIERNIPLKDIFGESLGTSTLSIFVDIINMFNRTEPFRLYDRTRDPDNDGVNLYRLPGEFPQGPWYAVEDPNVPRSLDPDQYDNVGNRLYNKNADANNDGMVTQDEEYRSFLNYVNDSIQRRGNYQYPRQVFFGVALRF